MQVKCASCDRSFEAKRRTAKYCGGTCRVRATRRRANGEVEHDEPTPAPAPEVISPTGYLPIVEATRRELEAAGRLHSVLGQQAMALAMRMYSVMDTGSAIASVSKELRTVMAAALADAPAKTDALDELTERRRRKASGG